MGYTIGQAAKKSGLSPYTLRFYEKEGLLPNIRKNSAGLRVFSEEDINWLQMIECLKGTGMSLKKHKTISCLAQRRRQHHKSTSRNV